MQSVCLLVYTTTHSLTHSLLHSLTHSLTPSLTHTRSLTHTHSHIHTLSRVRDLSSFPRLTRPFLCGRRGGGGSLDGVAVQQPAAEHAVCRLPACTASSKRGDSCDQEGAACASHLASPLAIASGAAVMAAVVAADGFVIAEFFALAALPCGDGFCVLTNACKASMKQTESIVTSCQVVQSPGPTALWHGIVQRKSGTRSTLETKKNAERRKRKR